MDSKSVKDMSENYKELGSLSESLDKKVSHMDAKAIQLAGVFVIFGAIMMLSSNDVVLQGKRWVPVCLSAWVSIAFWLTFITTVSGCIRIRQQQDLIFLEQERLHRKIFWIRNGRRQNGAAAGDEEQSTLAKPFAFLRFQRYAYVGVVHSALLSFTFLVSYALLPQL